MSGKNIVIEGPAGNFGGYLATPAHGTGPGVVVIQEIFGVNAVMRDISDWLAGEGYVALCPDLFWRIEPDIQLTDQTEAEWARAFELFQTVDIDAAVEDIGTTLSWLRGLEMCSGKAGVVGYCLGGQLAYLSACRTGCEAAVGYYGVNIHNALEEARQISRPLALHMAQKDEFVPPDAQETIRAGLADNKAVTLFEYPDRDHAFARPGGAHYHKDDAELANRRTLDFFRTHLG